MNCFKKEYYNINKFVFLIFADHKRNCDPIAVNFTKTNRLTDVFYMFLFLLKSNAIRFNEICSNFF